MTATTRPLGRFEVGVERCWEGVVLVALLLFVGVGAVYGGIGLMVNGMGMPAEWLDRTPVDTWALPGVALLVTVAVPQFAAAWLVLRRDLRAGFAGVVVGAALLLWILVQLVVLQRYYILQPVIAGIAVAESLVSAVWIRRSRRP